MFRRDITRFLYQGNTSLREYVGMFPHLYFLKVCKALVLLLLQMFDRTFVWLTYR